MKILLGLFFVFIFSFPVNAQTNESSKDNSALIDSIKVFLKTFDVVNADSETLSAQEKILDKYIVSANNQIDEKTEEIKKIPAQNTKDYPQIIRLNKDISELKKIVTPMVLKKKEIADKRFADSLPSDAVKLLKMLVIQNRQIIELLNRTSNF